MAKVQPVPWSGCWLWLGALNGPRYGYFGFGGRARLAHRVSYELHKGPIPDGLEIDHLCRVTFCVNPDHLEAVTKSVHALRGDGRWVTKARFAMQTHCRHGHLYDEANTMISGGKRYCRTCAHIHSRRSYYKMKEARRANALLRS
jgi:hypothetical protein